MVSTQSGHYGRGSQHQVFTMLRLVLVAALATVIAAAQCGEKPAQRNWAQYIVAGRETEQNAWPWQISMQLRGTDGSFSHICGAVLISEYWVVTAAHCTNPFDGPDSFRVVGGEHYLNSVSGREQVAYVDKVIEHEGFRMNTMIGVPHDIALLRLSSPMDLSGPYVKTACLPAPSVGTFAGNANCWISGWGKTWWLGGGASNSLQEAHIPVPTNEECKDGHAGVIRDTHICAGTGTPNACSGDSGGPMHCKVGNTWYVTGLTSWGLITCSGVPGVYTRLTDYYGWVQENTGLEL